MREKSFATVSKTCMYYAQNKDTRKLYILMEINVHMHITYTAQPVCDMGSIALR